ncbi:MAG: hypothetical protein EOO40_01910, partial [Deltaproteobacteria bacterium]
MTQQAQPSGGLLHDVWAPPSLRAEPTVAPIEGGLRDLPGWAWGLLARQGVGCVAGALDSYLRPSLQSLPDPRQMADMAPACERLAQALAAQEPIVIYGDYDVDGVCAAALLVSFLRGLG